MTDIERHEQITRRLTILARLHSAKALVADNPKGNFHVLFGRPSDVNPPTCWLEPEIAIAALDRRIAEEWAKIEELEA